MKTITAIAIIIVCCLYGTTRVRDSNGMRGTQ